MDGTSLAALLTAVGTLATVIGTKWGPVLLQALKITKDERKADREDALTLLYERVDKLEAELKETRKELAEARAAHHHCQIEQERQRAEIQHLKERLSRAEGK